MWQSPGSLGQIVGDLEVGRKNRSGKCHPISTGKSACLLRRGCRFPLVRPLDEWRVTRPESAGRLYKAGGVRPLWQRYDHTSRWITSVLPDHTASEHRFGFECFASTGLNRPVNAKMPRTVPFCKHR